MTKLRSLPYAVLTLSVLAAGSASAQSMSSIDAREAEQQQRIVNGIGDGSLTRGETYRLEQGERRIENSEARARADGHVSGYERQRLDNMLDRESHEIHQQRTDGQRAGGWNGGGWNGGGWNGGGWNRGSIDAREAGQQQRIVNGIRDGSLTRGEAYRLEQGERRVDNYEARARADGHVSGYERQRLDNMLDRESHEIHQQRTDGQRAGGWNGGNWNSADGRGGWQNGGHAPGGWNGGSNQGNWNQGGNQHGGGNTGSWNQGGWNQGGWNGHAPGTPSTPTTPTSGGQAGGWSHNGTQGNGWSGHTQGTPPATGGTAGWQGGSHGQPQPQAQMARPMPISAPAQQPAQPRTAFNGGGGSGRRH